MCDSGNLSFLRHPGIEGVNFVDAFYPPGYEFPRHIHDDLVIAITQSGAGRAETSGLSDYAGPNTLWISGAGEYHAGLVCEKGPWRYKALYISPSAIREVASTISENSQQIFSVPHQILENSSLSHAFLTFYETIKSGASKEELHSVWVEVVGIFLITSNSSDSISEPALNKKEEARILRVVELLREEFNQPITLQEMASIANLSRFHFLRLFKTTIGLSPHRYLNQIRVATAKNLLDQGYAPADVACRVGFCDQSHLNRLFKQVFAVTPGEYSQSVGVR